MKRKLKIGIVSFYHPHLGGSGVVATRTAIQLAKRGHEIFIISGPNAYNTESLHELGLNFFPVDRVEYPTLQGEPYTLELASKLVSIHNEFGLDIVHAHYGVPHAVSCFLAHQINHVPYVVTLHGSDATVLIPNPALKPVLQLSLEKAKRVFFVSHFLKNFSETDGLLLKNAGVLYDFVPVNLYRRMPMAHLKKSLGVPSDSLLVIHASNFREIKRPLDIVEAAGIVVRKNKNVFFVFVGDGPLLADCKARAEELEIEQNFRFIGRRDNLHDWFSISDIFVLASEFEGFGLAIAEAMACEVAVISSECGGTREIIEENKSGLFFQTGNVAQLADRIIALAADPQKRQKLAKEASKRISSRFSEKNIIDELEKTYYDILGE